jgi:hypothetical protein
VQSTITSHCVGKALALGRRSDSIVRASPCSYDESDGKAKEKNLYTLVHISPRGKHHFMF